MTVNDYIALITPQHRSKPKYIAWLTVAVNMIIDAQNFILSLDAAFDVDNAVGAQLDVLGQILGLNRLLNFQPSSGSALMPDSYYKVALKTKILSNTWDGTRESYQKMIDTLFPDDQAIIFDNQDMSIIILYASGAADTYMLELFAHGYLFPRPSAVSATYLPPSGKLFGYGYDNAAISGYGVGHWI